MEDISMDCFKDHDMMYNFLEGKLCFMSVYFLKVQSAK